MFDELFFCEILQFNFVEGINKSSNEKRLMNVYHLPQILVPRIYP
jgi:hypothetical protein